MKSIEEMIEEIGSRKSLRIEMWRDGSKSWRAGVEWKYNGEHLFLCEKKTLRECLECILENRELWDTCACGFHWGHTGKHARDLSTGQNADPSVK